MLEYPLGHEFWEAEASKSLKAADSDDTGTGSSGATWLDMGFGPSRVHKCPQDVSNI